MKKIVEMETEITQMENLNRQLECRGIDFECKFYSTLEEKLLNDKEYEQYINDKNDIIERLNFDLEEIKREVETKDEIIRKLKRQIEKNEVKTSIFINNEENFGDNNNATFTPFLNNRNSNARLSKALLNIDNFDNLNPKANKDKFNSNNEKEKNKEIEKSNLDKNSSGNIENNNNNSNNNIDIQNNISDVNNINNNTSLMKINSNNNFNNSNTNNGISNNNVSEEINENNKSNIFNSKNSKNMGKDDIQDLNIHTISEKIEDILNNSLKEFSSNFLDKSLINNKNIEKNNKSNNNTPINNKLNSSNDENEDKEYIRQIIDQEVKNILENRKTFILSTLTQENFSFDLVNLKILNTLEVNNNVNRKKYPNKAKIIENIDEILLKIQARREKVLNQKKLMMNKLEKMGIKIF